MKNLLMFVLALIVMLVASSLAPAVSEAGCGRGGCRIGGRAKKVATAPFRLLRNRRHR